MRALAWSVVVVSLATVPGCAAPVDDTADPTPATSLDPPTVDDVRLAACAAAQVEGEPIGEACEAFTACEIGCALCASAGCAAISLACGAGEVVTFGAATIPCGAALVAGCSAVVGAMAACVSACD